MPLFVPPTPVIPSTNDFRLTLTSGTAVTTSDVTGAGTLYLTPYKGQYIATYDSSVWTLHSSAEISLALTLTSGKNYDVFVYNNAGTLTLVLSAAWTNDTTRADAIAQQDGVWVKSSDHSRRLVGTIRATGTNTTEDSARRRFVWNSSNRMHRPLVAHDASDHWTSTNTAYHQANSSSTNQVEIVTGLAEEAIWITALGFYTNASTGSYAQVGIGEDSTSADSSTLTARFDISNANFGYTISAALSKIPAIGYHYYAWLESACGNGTTTFFGTAGTILTGLAGWGQG